MNAAVGHMDGSALMVIGVSAWYPDTLYLKVNVSVLSSAVFLPHTKYLWGEESKCQKYMWQYDSYVWMIFAPGSDDIETW